MSGGRFLGLARLVWGMPAVVAVPALMALAGGQAGAAARLDGTVAQSAAGQAAGVISTVAGGPGGPAKATTLTLFHPCGVRFAGGRGYLVDGAAVYTLSRGTDQLVPVAGSGANGPGGNRGLAADANFGSCGIAVDGAGNLVIADRAHNEVRVVAASTGTFYGVSMSVGHIYDVAGDGKLGYSGDGGLAIKAQLAQPYGVAVDGAGNLVIADTSNAVIRVAAARTGTFYGQAMTAGHIYTVAGDGAPGYSGDGGPATSAKLDDPYGVRVDHAGNLVIADSTNSVIRVVAADTGRFYGQAMTAGDIYTVAGNGTGGFSGDGGPATHAELSFASGVTVDAAGNLVIADTLNSRVRVVASRTGTFYGMAMTAGDIYTVAGNGTEGFSGDGSPATSAELNDPIAAAVDGTGNLVIADSFNNRVRVLAASTGTFYGMAMTAGDIYTVAGNGDYYNYSGDGGPAISAQLEGPTGVAVAGSRNLLIADTYNVRARMVASASGTFYGQPMTAGDIYTVAGDGTAGYSGDGGPATIAELDGPSGVAADGSGNLVIADGSNHRVRVVAASSGMFYGVTMTAGDIYTVAGDGVAGYSGDGGQATIAELGSISGVAVDGSGNLVIADTANSVIRVVAAQTGTFYGQPMTAGNIYTVAGDGTAGFSGNGGPATKAMLSHPRGVAMDSTGNLVIADTLNNRVRIVAVSTGTFYGITMTAGDIYTIAGDGGKGFAGDDGQAAQAELNHPYAVAVNDPGNLVIADTANSRIRMVTG